MFQSSFFNSIFSKYGQYLLAGLFLFIFSIVLVGRAGVLGELIQRGPKLAAAMEDCPDCGDAGAPTVDPGEGSADVSPSIPEEPVNQEPVLSEPDPAPQPEPVYSEPDQGTPVEVSPGTPADPACKQPGSCQGNVPNPPAESCTPNWQFHENWCISCGFSQSMVRDVNNCSNPSIKPSSTQPDTACNNYACDTTPPPAAPAAPVAPPPAQVCTPGQADVNSRACTGAPCTYTVRFCNDQGTAFDKIQTETNCSLAPATCRNACTPSETPRQTSCSNGQRCFRNHWVGTQLVDATSGKCSEGDGGEYCQSDASCGGSNPAPAAPAAAAPTAICMVCDNNGQTWRQAGNANMTAAACATNSNSQWNNTTRPAWCQPAVVNTIPQGTTATCNGQSGVVTLGNGSFLNCNINNNTNDNRSSAQGGSVTNVGNNNGATNVGNNNGAVDVGNNNGNDNGATLTNVGNNQGAGGSTTHPVVVITTSQAQDFSCPANTEKRVSGNTVMCLPLCRAGELRNVNGSSVICTAPGTTQQVVTVVQAETTPQKVAQVQVAADQLPKTGLPLAAWLLVGVAPLGAKMRRFGRSSKDEITPNLLWEERQFKKA